MTPREQILVKLRQAQQPATVMLPRPCYHMVPQTHDADKALQERFIIAARQAGCDVYPTKSESDTLAYLLTLISSADKILTWDTQVIPLPHLEDRLVENAIQIAASDDDKVRVGLTGVDTALAATGSLILRSGQRKARTVSLLPPIYIAIVLASQIVLDLETWFAIQRKDNLGQFRGAANYTIMTGPSKTADIGQELVTGAHGPGIVHIILLDDYVE